MEPVSGNNKLFHILAAICMLLNTVCVFYCLNSYSLQVCSYFSYTSNTGNLTLDGQIYFPMVQMDPLDKRIFGWRSIFPVENK